MTLTAKALLVYLVLALIVFAWMFRYDAKPISPSSGSVAVTDRWTGTVYDCGGSRCVVVYPNQN
jgi:hypothetical protein